eukprot:GSMAST32.ASY1.ANO1.1872.1 assembled CDS
MLVFRKKAKYSDKKLLFFLSIGIMPLGWALCLFLSCKLFVLTHSITPTDPTVVSVDVAVDGKTYIFEVNPTISPDEVSESARSWCESHGISQSADLNTCAQAISNRVQNINASPDINSSIEAKNLLADAMKLHRTGHLSKAIEVYSQLLKLDPLNGDAFHLLGGAFQGNGDVIEAIEAFQGALRVAPKVPQFSVSLAKILLFDAPSLEPSKLLDISGHHTINEWIESVLRSALNHGAMKSEISGNDLDALGFLMHFLNRENRPMDALKAFNKWNTLTTLDPKAISNALHLDNFLNKNAKAYAEYIMEAGLALHRTESLEDAVNMFEAAAAFTPNSSRPWMNAGVVLVALKQHDNAGKRFVRAVNVQTSLDWNALQNWQGHTYNKHQMTQTYNTTTKAKKNKFRWISRPLNKKVIAIYCNEYGNSWWPKWGWRTAGGGGGGGSGEAVVFLSRQLANIGYWVEVYAKPPDDQIGEEPDGNVVWYPHVCFIFFQFPIYFSYEILFIIYMASRYWS